MSQHDFNIDNQSFPATRTDINDAILAIVSNSSGDTEPSTTYANQWWYETDTNILKIRNEANNGWVDVITLDASMTATASELNQLDAITRGSILYGNASGETARLAAGAASTVLTSDGTDITWAAAAGGGTSLPFIEYPSNWASPNNTYTSSGTWSKGSLADDAIVWMYLTGGGQGGNSGQYSYAGGGADVILLCGTAGILNGGAYVIGAGGAGLQNGAVFKAGDLGGNSTFTLSSENGSVPFTTTNYSLPYANSDFFSLNVIYVNGANKDASNSFFTNTGAYSFREGTLPTAGGVTYLNWGAQGKGTGTTALTSVFGPAHGGAAYQNISGVVGTSLYGGAGGARNNSGDASDGSVPGGGGGGSYSASNTGGDGAAGNLRVYHV